MKPRFKLIRCKTPEDIIVIPDSHMADATAQGLVNNKNKCGHPHLILFGDARFESRIKEIRDIVLDDVPHKYQTRLLEKLEEKWIGK